MSGDKELKLNALIEDYVKNSGQYPFLQHIDYFRNQDGKINKKSIATNWAALSKESYFKTLIKAQITIYGSNYINQQNQPKSMTSSLTSTCPWKYEYDSSAELMPCLKHTRDSGIVNSDGSIDVEKLKSLMIKIFEYDEKNDYFFATKNSIIEQIQLWYSRDKHLEAKASYLMPSWETVTRAEWDDFFLNYVDCWKYDSSTNDFIPAITADSFLQFYFSGKTLYKRVFDGELPVKKPFMRTVEK
jgi:hypothetical protein